MVVSAPKDEKELADLLRAAFRSGRPFAIRYPRGFGLGVPDEAPRPIEIGTGEILRDGTDLFLLAYGSMVPAAMEAAESLATRGISCGVANARFAKPLDRGLLDTIAERAPRLLTLEEHLGMGGFGSAVLEALQDLEGPSPAARILAIPDRFIEHAPRPAQLASVQLDPPGIVERVLAVFPDLGKAARGGKDGQRAEPEIEAVRW
jgi:1-deoxy-D-xylulose-5-phosphate synthase